MKPELRQSGDSQLRVARSWSTVGEGGSSLPAADQRMQADQRTLTADHRDSAGDQRTSDGEQRTSATDTLTASSSAGRLPLIDNNRRQPGNQAKFVAVFVVAALLIAGAVLVYQTYGSKSAPSNAANTKEPPVVTVTTAPAAVRSVEDLLQVTGTVSAWDPLNVGAEISGLRINEVNVEEGDHVKKGQPLAILNSALIKAQLQQARARLQSSEANLKKSIQPNRPEDILALEAAYSQAEANIAQEQAHLKQAKENLSNAALNARRSNELANAGAISAQEAETKQLAADTAKEELKSAEQKVKAAQFTSEQAHQRWLIASRGGRTEDVDISKATIAEMKGQIQHLEEQLRQTVICSPDDGLVSRRDAHIGEITSVGTPMFSIIRLNKLELKAQVSDIDLVRFKTGQSVNISTHEDDKRNMVGKVSLVSPQVDATTRLGTVRIALPGNLGLKPGMFVRGEVHLGERQAVTVPATSLVTRNGESYVFRLEGNRAISCPVKVGIHSDTFIEITDGIKPGTVVIAKGARFLSDRDVVQVAL